MDNVNKTLYIPLYGKAYVSRRGMILEDKKAEEIWDAEGFELKGKSKSKWLAYYMGMRSAVFDRWLSARLEEKEEAVVIHIGCGMDSRILRVGSRGHSWYDVDFPSVIEERKRCYAQNGEYRMLPGDARNPDWLENIPERKCALVVMEGLSMYLELHELQQLMEALCSHFGEICLLTDCYSTLAAKMSRYKNPINDVGVTRVFGIDEPELLQRGGLVYVKEHCMCPQEYIDQLGRGERYIFSKLYAGGFAGKLYRLFEYRKN